MENIQIHPTKYECIQWLEEQIYALWYNFSERIQCIIAWTILFWIFPYESNISSNLILEMREEILEVVSLRNTSTPQ